VERALFRGQLIHHDATVVMDDPPAHAAIVILAVDAEAPARELHAARDDAVVIVILVVLAVC
jgi:hypothetical protein